MFIKMWILNCRVKVYKFLRSLIQQYLILPRVTYIPRKVISKEYKQLYNIFVHNIIKFQLRTLFIIWYQRKSHSVLFCNIKNFY